MKNKPKKHKDTNVFKFKSFNDRINEVDIRRAALYYIEHINETANEDETHFHQNYCKWLVLNLSEEYNEFQKQIKDIVTLPQIIHKKDFIVQLLLKSLEKATILSLQPLLEFIVVLAKDLREEFYPYFQSILNRLILLLDTKDPDQIEWSLICLAFLFKTLKPYLKKDITIIFKLILPLLDSNKEYISNFAAECFSFIVRDIRDKEKFLLLILTNLKNSRNEINGCGRLLFEIIRGVNGQLHKCAEDFLNLYLNGLKNPIFRDLLFPVLTECIKCLFEYAVPQNVQIFWHICYNVVDGFLKDKQNDKSIQMIIILLRQAVENRNGKYLIETLGLNNCLMRILDNNESNDVILETTRNIAAILLSPNLLITQLDASRMCKKVLDVSTQDIFESFVWNTVNYSQFDILILPAFLRYFECNVNGVTLELLAKIILKKVPLYQTQSGINYTEWKSLHIRFKEINTIKTIENNILAYTPTNNIKDSEKFLLSLIIYPHILDFNIDTLADKMVNLVNELCKMLNAENMYKEFDCIRRNQIIFVLSILIESILHFGIENKLDVDNIITSLLPYCSDIKYIQTLRILDIIIVTMNKKLITFELFQQLHKILSDNLSSEYHDIRLLTTHILKLFSWLPELNQQNWSIYEICYDIEVITPNVENYREQIQLLEKMSTEMQLYKSLETTQCKLDPFKFLLGTLYQNFKLLWQPTSSLIIEYAIELNANEFWEVFKKKLHESVKSVRNINKPLIEFDTENNFLLTLFNNSLICNERIDFINYRILLWKIIPQCGNLKEIKNREIITLFLDFIDNEYRKTQDADAFSWNIISRDKDVTLNNEDNRMEPPKATQRTLITKLSVFVDMTNPTQLYRESDLYKVYLELLQHKNTVIEKLALDCLLTYKHKYLIPYKEHLYNLINDEQFKNAITNFNIDKESNVILQEHRLELMPILMRILHTKMFTKDTKKTQKGANQIRKSLVMRFLGGCYEDEIMVLLKMSFQQYEKYFEENSCDMIKKIIHEINLERIVSAKKLQSSLSLIELIQEKFGGLMGLNFLKYILNILLIIGAIIEGVLLRAHRIHSGYLNIFKTLKNTCTQSIIHFFDHFDHYEWVDYEIEAIFIIFINSMITNLSNDSIHSPTAILKLLLTFGKNPRYFILFTKQQQDSENHQIDETPLKHIMNLLLNVRTKPKVCLSIMELIQNLLTFSDEADKNFEYTVISKPIIIRNCSTEYEKILLKLPKADQINFGSKILLPYMPQILDKIRLNIEKKRGLTKRDLLILSRSTELISDTETCSTLLTLLLPILIRKSHPNAAEDILIQMVETILNLLTKISNPEQHIRNIAPLFEQVTAVGPRKLLCGLLQNISNRYSENEDLKRLSDVAQELNAWDRRWVEQPDYEKRLNAYKKIDELQKQDKLDINLGLIVVYHSFYFIKYDKDLAMRDSASYHLKSIVPALARKYRNNAKELDYLIDTVILNIVRRTIREKNDNVRNEGILLLGEMSRECPDIHPILSDLNLLTSKEDREVDFFDNITHLQVHRHGKALMRFCSIVKTLEKAPNSRTLTRFILPLVSMYICTEKYVQKHGIVTAAIETIGVVCRLLPWYQYESILKFYLEKMKKNIEYQKQLVRIVMTVLDSFHFDLTTKTITPEISKALLNNVQANEEIDILVDDKKDEIDEEIVLTVDDNIDDVLDTKFDEKTDDLEDVETNDEIIPIKKIKMFAYDRQTMLSHKAAQRIIHTIAVGLLPALNKSITTISTYESFHKVNKKKRRSEREEEEILRVPISLAMVKLLQKLPKKMLDDGLPGIFIKVCMFLKSPLKSVRMVTRDILKNVMLTVGSEYLNILLNQMTTLLTRGFQVHVLTVTVYGILDAFKHQFKSGEIDKNLSNILSVCLEDIFGKTSEEKEIIKIGAHTPEAKPSNKSYLTLQIVAGNITESCLLDLMIPFKDQLIKTQSKKNIIKIQECFQKIIIGLIANKNLTIETLLIFIYGTVSESIPELLSENIRPILTESEKEKLKRQPTDCFIIPEEPRNRKTGENKKIIKTNIKANAHVLIEFGLEMLQILLGRGKLLKINNYEQYLNPLILILQESLKSVHVRATIFALKCFTSIWNRKMKVSKLIELIKNIVPEILIILHKYATAGMSTTNENFSLVKNAFKAIVSLMRFVEYFSVTTDQLKTLLLYVEQNLYDSNKQTIAFSLLKAIIERHLLVPDMQRVIKKVSELAILSDSNITRQEAKSIIVNYLMEYPLGKKVDNLLKFFINNLNYEVASGRESVIQIIHLIIKRFPQDILNKQCGFLFISLGTRLINDDSIECRKLVADAIETLLLRIDKINRNELFAIIIDLLNDEKSSHREMAAILCSRYITIEKQHFINRIENIFPLLLNGLANTDCPSGPGKFVKLIKNEPQFNNHNENNYVDKHIIEKLEEDKQRAKDHQIIQILNTILKILEHFPQYIEKLKHFICELAYEAQKLLAYEHVWVRLNAVKILELVLNNIDINRIQKQLLNSIFEQTSDVDNGDDNYYDDNRIYSNPQIDLKSLALDLCAQLIPNETDVDMTEQVFKNLLYIANILQIIPLTNDENGKSLNLIWLIRRIRRIINAEVAKAPQSTIFRTAVFHWIESLLELIDDKLIESILYILLPPLVREMSEDDKNIDPKLRQLAIKVGNQIKSRIGEDKYNLLRSQLQTKLMIKRAERKKEIAQIKVYDPVRAAMRKKGEKERKKTAKKRKIDVIKGRALPQKKKIKKDIDDLF